MRIKLLIILAAFPAILSAQERFTVRGRIVDEKGEAVEYVHVGIPGLGIGTISSVDGFKSSYYRESSLAGLQYIPINIGISVKGLEYQ